MQGRLWGACCASWCSTADHEPAMKFSNARMTSDASSRTDQACLNQRTSARHAGSEDWACMQGAADTEVSGGRHQQGAGIRAMNMPTRFGDSLQGHANMAMSPPPHPPSIYPQVGLL